MRGSATALVLGLIVSMALQVTNAAADAPPTVTIGTVSATFYPNPGDSGSFDPGQLSSPAFTQSFPVIDFNPPSSAQVGCSNATGVDENTRPFTDVIPNGDGTCSTQVVAGAGLQAGVGSLNSFEATLTADLTVGSAAQVTFNFFSDDGWILGLGRQQGGSAQPTYVSGQLSNPPPSSEVEGFPVVGALNGPSSPTQAQVTVDFPAAGTYPMEVDYTECCGGQLSLTLGTTAGNPIPPSSSDYLYGFGDSIAAGYGLGPAAGQNDDNPNAYPAQLAAGLGLSLRNFASAGACATSTDAVDPYSLRIGNCTTTGQIPLDQQIANAPASPAPKLITLTVGANDIDFQGCFQAVVYGTYNNPSQDPCEPKTNLPTNLSLFSTSLAIDLAALNGPSGKYPGVPVLITGYYNPMPSGSQPLCVLNAAIGTWLYVQASGTGSAGEILSSLLKAFIRPDAFTAGLQQVQGAVFNRANYILGHLDGVIQQVAGAAPGVTYAPVSFAGHDMCQGPRSWAFGPDLSVSLSLSVGNRSFSASRHFAPAVCPAVGTPDGTLEQSFGPFGPTFPVPGNASASASLSGSTNCLPHPTQTGQQQIAAQLAPIAAGLIPG